MCQGLVKSNLYLNMALQPSSSDESMNDETKQRKVVSFAPEATEYLISLQMTPQEHSNTWYHPLAFAEFKKSNRTLGKAIRQRRTLFDEYNATLKIDPLIAEKYESSIDEDVTRGIEHFCCAVYFEDRKRNKQATVQAVLKEQSRQKGVDIHDEEAIAEVARSCTKEQRELALKFGELDERACKEAAEWNHPTKLFEKCRSLERPMSPRSVTRFDTDTNKPATCCITSKDCKVLKPLKTKSTTVQSSFAFSNFLFR